MLVSEAFFESELLSLVIMNPVGDTYKIEVNPSDKIGSLKFRLPSFFLKLEDPTESQNYKMVLVSKCKVLTNDNSVAMEELKNNDEILIVARRTAPKIDPLPDEALKGPWPDEIDKATAKLKESSQVTRNLPLEPTVDLDTEIRKVFISLVETAARVLAHTPQANQVIELIREKKQKKSGLALENIGYGVTLERSNSRHSSSSSGDRSVGVPRVPDPNVVAQMVDMGFSEEMVIRALRRKRMDQSLAVEWLLENSPSDAGSWSTADDEEENEDGYEDGHEDDFEDNPEEDFEDEHDEDYDDDNDDDDDDLEDDAYIPVVRNLESRRWMENVSSDGQEVDQGHFLLGVTDEAIGGAANVELFKQDKREGCQEQQNVKSWSAAEIMRSFDSFKKPKFVPNPEAMSALLQMGFGEEEVIEALKVTDNCQFTACEWLLSEIRSVVVPPSSSSWEEADKGLDPNSSTFKAILAEPLVQMSLTNPKLVLAYLSILETPSSSNIWINDVDASPVLNKIFTIYYGEKHVVENPDEAPRETATSNEGAGAFRVDD